MTKLTIYTPVYNASKFLELTFQSIINQSFTDWEYLLLDDGSTDSSKLIIEKYAKIDKRIKYQFLEHTGNPATIRNLAITTGSGDWFASCDHDDIWHPLKLELQFDLINKYKTEQIVFTNGKYFKNPPNELNIDGLYDYLGINRKLDRERVNTRKMNNNDLLQGNHIMNSSVLVHKTVYNQVGLLNEDISLRGIEDYDFWLRAACLYINFFQVDEILSFWREYEGNLSKIEPYQKYQEILKLITNARKCKNLKVEKRFDFYYMISYIHLLIDTKKFQQNRSFKNRFRFMISNLIFYAFVIPNKDQIV